jgi:5-methylcytosine-specific restriction endonuclease McrA
MTFDQLPAPLRHRYVNRAKHLNARAARKHTCGRVNARALFNLGRVCAYCGGWADTFDHVIPLAHEGTGDVNNLVACCAACNHAKGDRLL